MHEIHVSTPALAVAADGAVHLAWSRRDGAGSSVWTARVGAGEPVRVDPTGVEAVASHDAPGLAIGPDGRVHVLWSARRRPDAGAPIASNLLLSTSGDGGASFGPPLAVGGPALRTRDFASLAVSGDGALLAAWLEIGGPRASAHVARIDPVAGRVSADVVLEESACVCCRTAVASGPGGAAGVLWRGERAGNVRDMFWARSSDGGRRFATPEPVHADGWSLDACPHRGGAIAFDAAGRAAAAWYTEGTRAQPSLRLATAAAGAAFGPPRELHAGGGSFPDHVVLALSEVGPGLVVFESATAVRREIVARALAPAVGSSVPPSCCRERCRRLVRRRGCCRAGASRSPGTRRRFRYSGRSSSRWRFASARRRLCGGLEARGAVHGGAGADRLELERVRVVGAVHAARRDERRGDAGEAPGTGCT